ncbi:MAG: hypothetical protein LBC86_00325 [Oscillospiraceae bacterium]|nr:hypothetical protein [Oscillospiraceae bacterium]
MANWFTKQIAAFKYESAKARYTAALQNANNGREEVLKGVEKIKDKFIHQDMKKYTDYQYEWKFWTAEGENGKSRMEELDELKQQEDAAKEANTANPKGTRVGRFFARLLGRSVDDETANSVRSRFEKEGSGWNDEKRERFRYYARDIDKWTQVAETSRDMKRANKANERDEKFVGPASVSNSKAESYMDEYDVLSEMDKMNEMNEKNEKFVGKIDISKSLLGENKQSQQRNSVKLDRQEPIVKKEAGMGMGGNN